MTEESANMVFRAFELFLMVLQEHGDADTVQVIWTAVIDQNITQLRALGSGNTFAREKAVEEWLRNESIGKIAAPKSDDDDDDDDETVEVPEDPRP